jgi:L-2-hydroxyglutarate oxidase LhgO
MTRIKATIIGGGVIGCAVAYELSKYLKGEICLLEKNLRMMCENQSLRNSGVVHAGIYYPKKKEPLKAKLCVEGNKLLYDFCEEHEVQYKQTGKLVVANTDMEEEYLDDVLRIALGNGVPGIKKISRREALRMEPNVEVQSALYVPTSGIVEAAEFTQKLCSLAKLSGVYILPGNEVVDINVGKNTLEVRVNLGGVRTMFETEILINAAGLYSDEIAKIVNPESPYEIDPVRGESAKFYKSRREDISMEEMNVYPAPYGYYTATGEKADVSLNKFKRLLEEGKITRTVGVHLTPTFNSVGEENVIGKTVIVGPIKTTKVGKEDYGFNLKPEEKYLEMVKSFFPNLRKEDIQLHQTGIMAVLKRHPDFVIERDKKFPNCINLIGIDSPGLTASLAIGKYVMEMLG